MLTAPVQIRYNTHDKRTAGVDAWRHAAQPNAQGKRMRVPHYPSNREADKEASHSDSACTFQQFCLRQQYFASAEATRAFRSPWIFGRILLLLTRKHRIVTGCSHCPDGWEGAFADEAKSGDLLHRRIPIFPLGMGNSCKADLHSRRFICVPFSHAEGALFVPLRSSFVRKKKWGTDS